jgi:uncharacterized membrane protein YhaH (DUF805 family)
MTDLLLVIIVLVILVAVLVGSIVVYVLTMRNTVKQNKRLYRDYAQKLIPGLSGGVIVIILTQLATVMLSNYDLLAKSIAILILITVLAFFITLSFSSYITSEDKYGNIPKRRGLKKSLYQQFNECKSVIFLRNVISLIREYSN